jgi:hypothetical protein
MRLAAIDNPKTVVEFKERGAHGGQSSAGQWHGEPSTFKAGPAKSKAT